MEISTTSRKSMLELPAAPADQTGPVKVWRQPVELLTYLPDAPSLHPMFLEKRVYQGSSGRVYPLPFYDRIATDPAPHLWDAIHLENEFIRIMVLPEIGGRIHIGYDKRTGYDFFYRQNVIKPALVGLAGPWVSGGVEFNWPQHHRPATFMPVHTEIEQHPDGSVTVWCSDHDPMLRMKGMHGVRLRPGQAILDLNARLYNRTPYTQTFLWWANVATRVHEAYQSFFPPDVTHVADHAKRAITTFPLSESAYYGVDYPGRAQSGVPADEAPEQFLPDGSYAANDLSWYANIPVPTSYMITGTEGDFFGGYDHAQGAGVVHVANHHIVPGKKQWTWGNHEFGYAWDRSLTLEDGPYIELMAGAYTDNQPDFSYLAPWETKTFTQSWFPIQRIGIPQAANRHAALHVGVAEGVASVALQVTEAYAALTISLRVKSQQVRSWELFATPAEPLLLEAEVVAGISASDLSVVIEANGRVLLAWDPAALQPAGEPKAATEPLEPAAVASVEELYLIGLHLSQYRHATRDPELYWGEALARDPQHSSTHNALGLNQLARGEFAQAAQHFQTGIDRLTLLNPNPRDGECFYNLGLTERFLGRQKQAYDALYKATWNAAWRSPAYFALAEIDCQRGDWAAALDHVDCCLRAEADHLNARNLKVTVLRRLGREQEADEEHAAVRKLDPLDLHSRWQAGIAPTTGQDLLDLAFDLLRSGQAEDALRALGDPGQDHSLPILLRLRAQVLASLGRDSQPTRTLARAASLDYCFPSRLEEFSLLEQAVAADSADAGAHALLGHFLYDRRRYREAITAWEKSLALAPTQPVIRRSLGIAYFNVEHDAERALAAFDGAFAADPTDARILYERDQLWKRTAQPIAMRLAELERYPALVEQRDDLTVELATLLYQSGRPQQSLDLILGRHFQPWEGGEGLVLGAFVRAQLALGRQALDHGRSALAAQLFEAALHPPQSLGEASHLLANRSDVYYWLAQAASAAGQAQAAAHWSQLATSRKGDFQQMSVRTVSAMTYWTGMAQLQSGQAAEARQTFEQILAYAVELERTEPKIDYFATSLPAMLLFDDDLALRNKIDALILRAQALVGLGSAAEASALLQQVLTLDPSRLEATDLLAQSAAAERKA